MSPWQLTYTKSYDDKWEEVEDLTPNSNLEEGDTDLMNAMGSKAQLPTLGSIRVYPSFLPTWFNHLKANLMRIIIMPPKEEGGLIKTT